MQYEIIYNTGDPEKILVIRLPSDSFFANLSEQVIILVLITPWNTDSRDVSKKDVYMTSQNASFIIDIQSIWSATRLMEMWNRWGIIDRSGESIAIELMDNGNDVLDVINDVL